MTVDRADAPLAVLGAGVMGSAILSSVVDAGRDPSSVRVTSLDEDALRRWEGRGVTAGSDNADAVRGAGTVLVAVKPAGVRDLLDEIGPSLDERALVVCIAAGVTLATLEEHLPEGVPVVRVMPNTPALLGRGMSALSPGTACTDADVEDARTLLAACGDVVVVAERDQEAVTAISGSGPAYVFALAEAMIDGGVMLGLARPVAARLAAQTLAGAAAMLQQDGAHPGLLREQVTSPGGSTAAGLRELDRHGFRSAVISCQEAVHRRSAELGG